MRAEKIMHGKLSHIQHGSEGVFDGLPDPLTVTRYHSLVIAPDSMPDCLDIAARTDDGIIMAVKHRTRPRSMFHRHNNTVIGSRRNV